MARSTPRCSRDHEEGPAGPRAVGPGPGGRAARITRRLLTETPTLGVRAWPVFRTVLDRAHVAVETPHGPVRIKVGSLDGETLNAAPEYEDVRARAEATGVPFKQVWAEALAAYARRR